MKKIILILFLFYTISNNSYSQIFSPGISINHSKVKNKKLSPTLTPPPPPPSPVTISYYTENSPRPTLVTYYDNKNSFTNISTDSLNNVLNNLKNALKNTWDTSKIDSINEYIKHIREINFSRFLSTDRPTQSFTIFHHYRYNTDSINNYLYRGKQINFLQTLSYTQNFDNGSNFIGAELASALFGASRIGIGGSILSNHDSSKKVDENIQNIIRSGGNLDINYAVPLFLQKSRNDKSFFSIFAQNIIGLTLDTLNATSFKPKYFVNQCGITLNYNLISNDKTAALAFDLPIFYTFGSKELFKKLGISNYAIVKGQLALSIANQINIKAVGVLWSSNKQISNSPWSISFGINPNQIVQKKS